jgi:hypothetical protein
MVRTRRARFPATIENVVKPRSSGDSQSEPLLQSFESRDAFAWRCQCASQFGFSLQYPRSKPLQFFIQAMALGLDAVNDFAAKAKMIQRLAELLMH